MSRITNRTLFVLLVVLIACMVVPMAFSQETTATVTGTVKDQTGAVVANATVEVTSGALIGTRKVTTDSSGSFRVSQLPPGEYVIAVTAAGFRAQKQNVGTLQAGREASVDISLTVGATGETVEVSEQAPIVDVTSSKVVATVEKDQMVALPKAPSRSFQGLIPFAPGARQEPMMGTTGGRTNGFQIDGASDGENVYMIDGVNITNVQNGGVGKNFQDDFVQEVQIKSSSFEAEFGGALGGVVNAIPQRGSNNWHGQLVTYYQSTFLDANDPCASGFTSAIGGSTVCGLRINPTGQQLSQSARIDGNPEYYVPKKDNRHVIEPGYSLGGPIVNNRLWMFSSYIPTIDTTKRTTTFTGNNPGARQLVNTNITHNMYNRLDYRALNSLRLYASWNYAYNRSTGTLGAPDSAWGQVNTGRTTDPNTLRADAGSVNPSAVYSFGGDWTPTSKLVVSAKYGYFYSNGETRGAPIGIRYIYDATVNASSKDLAGQPFPASTFNTSGFANIPSNFATVFNPYRRKSWNADVSYFFGHAWGTHTVKTGYFWAGQRNDVLATFNPALVDLFWGQSYTPVTSGSACDQVIAQNKAAGLPGLCQGRYGYFVTGTGVSNTGFSAQTAQAYYVQDAWNVGHGLTLNLGIRLDEENQPPYDAKRFPAIHFGWGDKIAPRIGGAYDLLHNGKVKIYASYGKFYDIMKMGLARGSFGSDYWHSCYYALDDPNYTSITPQGGAPAPGGCPASGPATGIPGTSGRFIENVDFRATHADPRDPAIQSNMKPMSQHEFVTGADWAISPNWSLTSRYSRKRLDNTIEDMAITDNLGFYIGNPGSTFADVLRRPVSLDPDGKQPLVTFCAECPKTIGAIRNYDGVEFALTRRSGTKWFGTVSYQYSKLRGNYPGLTNSDPTDGGGGRHSPNNSRLFDLPTMTYLPNGKIDSGPLDTDRPHTAKAFGYYTIKWFGMNTVIGANQMMLEGSPISSCLPVVGSSSACQWAEGRGNFVKFHRDASGNIVKDGVVNDARTAPYFQTDLSLSHEIKVSKTHENYAIKFEGNAYNLFNQHAAVGYYQFVIPANLISPNRPTRFAGDPGVDWNKVMVGYNYVDALNATGAFAGKVPGTSTNVATPLTYANRYGLPQVFQTARQFRFAVRFVF